MTTAMGGHSSRPALPLCHAEGGATPLLGVPVSAEYRREDERVRDAVWMIEKCRDLGGVDLDRTDRTIGFERRRLRADTRPRAAAAWGHIPADRE